MKKKIEGFKTFESSDSSGTVGRIVDLMKNNTLSFHKKVLNIAQLAGVEIENLKLPPLIIPCKITLNNGDKYTAYLESNRPPYRFNDDEDKYLWVEYGNSFRRTLGKQRREWKLSDVKEWEFI
jgi:hypothetical protein